jgi:hypothetical protein
MEILNNFRLSLQLKKNVLVCYNSTDSFKLPHQMQKKISRITKKKHCAIFSIFLYYFTLRIDLTNNLMRAL